MAFAMLFCVGAADFQIVVHTVTSRVDFICLSGNFFS